MGPRPSRSLLEILRSTVVQVEKNSDLAPDDPAVVEFKRTIMRSIAELEAAVSSVPAEVVSQAETSRSPEIPVNSK
jgi:hypothetical protein